MLKFDTRVQELKYKVLKEVTSSYWNDTLQDDLLDLPLKIVPGKTSTMRCCVYKERAILAERLKIAMGGPKDTEYVINVIDIACDECPTGGYEVTNACRGCLAHYCERACKKNAISYDKFHVAHIDKQICVECGMCAKVCPYTAIVHRKRPCQNACKVKAISFNEDQIAVINQEKCISCGACVYQCPFGAIVDRSYILKIMDILKQSENNTKYNVYACLAPAVATQFTYAKLGQIVTGIKNLGFKRVFEAALGADMVASKEALELAEHGFLTSSCCPAFVDYIKINFPKVVPFISSNLSPMAEVCKFIKENDKTSKIVFIGPCTAKKKEIMQDHVKPYVDAVMTFEELQAMFGGVNIDLTTLEESKMDDASYFGRIFARSGGVTEAIKQGLKEIGRDDFEYNPMTCNGIEECKVALVKKNANILKENFIEGMACVGGCIGGAGCLSHERVNSLAVDKYGKNTVHDSISAAINSAK